MKARITLAIGIILGISLFAYAMHGVDFAKLAYACKQADYFLLFLLLFTNLFEAFLRSVKWQQLLAPSGNVKTYDVFRTEVAGLALNNILPFRLGEILRGIAGASVFKIPAITVFATIFVERALDIVALIILLCFIGLFGNITSEIFQYKKALVLLFAAVICGIAFLTFAEKIIKSGYFSSLFNRFPALENILLQIAIGARVFQKPFSGLAVVLTAVCQWFVNSLSLFVLIYAFHIEDILGIFHAIALTVASAIACSIPAMPGFFGNYEAGVSGVMAAWGVARDKAFALAFTGHVLGYVVITVLGICFVYTLGYSIGKVWSFRSKKDN